jgi:hypothetical protein
MEMTFAHFLMIAYGVMGAVALFGYLPQIIAFYKNPMLCQETPLTSWVLWGFQTVTFHLYALVVNGDMMFIINTGAFMLATLGCLYMQLRGRRIAKKLGLQGKRAVVVKLVPSAPIKPIRPNGRRVA